MADVVILALADPGTDATPADRVPVRACLEALRAVGASADVITARSDAEIDSTVKLVDAGEARLVVAAASDAEVRAVVRRMVRRYAPPPSRRPSDLPAGRTVFDLPPIGLLALTPAVPDLIRWLGLPTAAADVAAVVRAGRQRRLDLLRTDAGSVTLGASLLGGVDPTGRPAPWRGRVELDDVVLSDGTEPLLACAITNLGRTEVSGLPLVPDAQPDDGRVDVALAVPRLKRRLLHTADIRYEVRRARGRACSVVPGVAEVRLVDDGVTTTLTHRRAWWLEPGAWAVYVM